jgi:TIR domain-containing protein
VSYKAFISSTVEDLDLARDLAQRLESAGVTVKPVGSMTAAGEVVFTKIRRELRQADEIFVIVTNDSVHNSNLMFEMGAASSLKKRVTPVIVGLKPTEVPSLIKNMRHVQYPELADYIKNLEERLKVA